MSAVGGILSPASQTVGILAPQQQPPIGGLLAANQAPINPIYARNAQYIKPGAQNFNTSLDPQAESAFRAWVAQNKIPFDPSADVTDYDMRGFYKALQQGDPIAKNAIDPNDGRMHYPDYWKTPYHETFSNESQWAKPNAPHWTDDDKLVAPDGTVIFDDRAKK